MTKTRLEAFSDGVIAIIITIMVLELRPPSAMDWHSLRPLAPVFLSYLLSFVILGEYWANHHHVLQAVKHVGGTALWANLHLLFWMSLYPFATSWLGKTNFESIPLFFFGVIQFCSAVAYFVLVRILIRDNSNDSPLVIAVGNDLKGKASIVAYVLAMLSAFKAPWLATSIFAGVALMWIVPDKRIERALKINST